MLGEIKKINKNYKDTFITIAVRPQKSGKLKEGDLVKLDVASADKRTLRQNSYLWARLNNLNDYLTGGEKDGELDIYIQLLERAGAKTEYIMATEEAGEALKKVFRAVKMVGQAPDGLLNYRCYYGSSNFTAEEMARLLDELTELEYELYNKE